jgi:hypothetical protein
MCCSKTLNPKPYQIVKSIFLLLSSPLPKQEISTGRQLGPKCANWVTQCQKRRKSRNCEPLTKSSPIELKAHQFGVKLFKTLLLSIGAYNYLMFNLGKKGLHSIVMLLIFFKEHYFGVS